MGCDIHCYAEKRVNGVWKLIGEATRHTPEEDESKGRIDLPSVYDDRNYNLFAILANVRNGRGFAGRDTGDGFQPIAMPKGLPDDVCAEIKELSDDWDVDGHSHSYHTLRDILNYDWTQTTKLRGWCNAVEWARWSRFDRQYGRGPGGWCGGVSGGAVKHVTPEQMDALLEPVKNEYADAREKFAEQFGSTYAQAEWTETYSHAAGESFFETVMRLLKEAGGVDGVDDVRLVFWFDN